MEMKMAAAAMLISFLISVIMGKVGLPLLISLKVGQTVRDDGPETHLKKTGTPTMGGLLFMVAFLVTGIIFSVWYPLIRPVLALSFGFGLVGFADDYIKVVKKRSLGLKAWQKLALQIIVTVIFVVYMRSMGVSMEMRIPFTCGKMWDPGILGWLILFLAVLGTVNGTNLTDGVDALATSVTLVVASFFGIASLVLHCGETVGCAAMVGALMGFLVYNVNPAQMFMGDTGSLAIGGFVAGVAYMMQMPLFIIPVGIIYVAETMSVILQVGYFKVSHGKRLFRMAPLHHHFEKGGWKETKVVAVFTIVTVLFSVVTFAFL